jgi:hypothetical protein
MILGRRSDAMTRARSISLATLVAALAIAPAAVALTQTARDREAVRMAALDYVEGIYTVQPERVQRSVHPALVKRGFYKKDASTPYVEMPMTYEQLVTLSKNWNREGKRDTSIKQVEVYDVLDQTAVAKVTASWGIDYMLLGKFDGTWKITQILWQSPPPTR